MCELVGQVCLTVASDTVGGVICKAGEATTLRAHGAVHHHLLPGGPVEGAVGAGGPVHHLGEVEGVEGVEDRPRIDPWGTPASRGRVEEMLPEMEVHWEVQGSHR